MSKLLPKLMPGIALVATAIVLFMPTISLAATDTKTAICEGIGVANSSKGCDTSGGMDINSVVASVINILSFLVGVAAVVMVIIGGFKYVTSNGDSAGIKSAKDTIVYAIVGLVIVAIAQIIVRFVLNSVT